MNFKTYFRIFSYAMLAVATLVLLLAGGLSVALAILFWLVMAVGWKAEGTRWQLSERTVLVVVLLSIPLFLLDWKFQQSLGETAGKVGVTALAHLIVFLSAVKLLQDKRDRDWVFLYLISFFEVLLAAGLSFSPVFLGSLTLYLLCSVSTIIAFEIQKSKRSLPETETHLLVPPDSRIFKTHARRQATPGSAPPSAGCSCPAAIDLCPGCAFVSGGAAFRRCSADSLRRCAYKFHRLLRERHPGRDWRSQTRQRRSDARSP